MDFPSHSLRFASAAVHIFGASILAYCFAARISSGHFTWTNWRQVPWARWCIMLVFMDSWMFHVSAGLLIQGPGVSKNEASCASAIYLCISIYCLSKILIYCFLIERVYVVWPHNGRRLSSKAYCLCLVTLCGYVVVTTLMIVGRNASFDSNNSCIIGLKPFASIPLLSYDLFLNVFLTSMFLWPLQQAHFRDVRLRKIATRTLFAAIVALTTSTINIAVLTIKHGQEPGWICLLSCGVDVTVNALVLYWVTGYRPDDTPNINYLTTINFTLPYSTQSIAITSSRPDRPSRPELTIPAPTRDKSKTHRPSPVSTSRETGPSHGFTPDGQMSSHEWSSVRELSIEYPDTPETGQWERRMDPSVFNGSEVQIERRWWRRMFRREKRMRADEENEKAEAGARVEVEVAVSAVHRVDEAWRRPYSGVGRDSASIDSGRDSEVCQ